MQEPRNIQPEDLVSISEIARYIGVTKSRASQYVEKPWFPDHIAKPAVGRIWYMPDVKAAWEAHVATTRRRHRPPTSFAANADTEDQP